MSSYFSAVREEKQGFLLKRGKATKVDPNPAWKKRWFELDLAAMQLKYYKNQNDIATKVVWLLLCL